MMVYCGYSGCSGIPRTYPLSLLPPQKKGKTACTAFWEGGKLGDLEKVKENVFPFLPVSSLTGNVSPCI